MSYTLKDIYSKQNEKYQGVDDLKVSIYANQQLDDVLETESNSSNTTIRRVATYIKNNPTLTSELRLVIVNTLLWDTPDKTFFNFVDQLHKAQQQNTLLTPSYLDDLLYVDDTHNVANIDDQTLQSAITQFIEADNVQSTNSNDDDDNDDEPFDFDSLLNN